MSQLSPYQQRALLGAWYSIVGNQPGGYPQAGHPAYLMGANPYVGAYHMGADAPMVAPAPVVVPPPMAMPPVPAPAVPSPHHHHMHHHHQRQYQQQEYIPPRNVLVQDPGPDRAGREVLPMSTGVPILPTQSAQITARPQRVAFRPERVFISAAGTSGGAADWVVNDIKIGNRSQFSQSGDVPGDMFATNAIDGFVSFETAQTAMDVVMVVTYIGLNESGVPFFASIVGTAAV
jgi:hypothetical protein